MRTALAMVEKPVAMMALKKPIPYDPEKKR
jgi:hypothetical protein